MEKGHIPSIESVFVAIGSDTTSESAFAHALAIALVNRSALTLFLPQSKIATELQSYPSVRRTLERWKLLPPNSDRSAVFEQLAIRVRKIHARGRYGRACLNAIAEIDPDLVIVSSEARGNLVPRSKASAAFRFGRQSGRQSVRESNALVLYVPSEGRGFVAPIDGYLSLRRILVPATEASTLPAALAIAISLVEAIGDPPVTIQVLGGDEKPQVSTQRESKAWKIEVAACEGNPIDAVLGAARGVDLVVLPAAGHDGVPRSLHETNTDRVVRAAPCPVLAIPTP